MRSAFVSHSTSDDRYVAEMESFLRAAGYEEVFNDLSAIRSIRSTLFEALRRYCGDRRERSDIRRALNQIRIK